MNGVELIGFIIDIDYRLKSNKAIVRITFKSKEKVYTLLDPSFPPYFYLVPHTKEIDHKMLMQIRVPLENNEEIKVTKIEERKMTFRGKEVSALRVYTENPRNVPRLSEMFKEFGTCYENDILFWKRYLIDKKIVPLVTIKVQAHYEGEDLIIDQISNQESKEEVQLKYICFDLESYNPSGAMPRMEKDPIIMISYSDGSESAVLTTKKINKPFVKLFENEAAMLQGFVDVVRRIDPDVLAGYNSSNFDLPYLMKRCEKFKINFAIGRYKDDEVRSEHHGLIEAVKIPGRINMDVYNVARFVSIVGASEKLIKVNSFKLDEVYRAITGKEKKMVEKYRIWEVWDKEGEELENLSEYSLGDSLTLNELFSFFLPLELEVTRVSGTTLNEATISTTSQLVEYMLMRYAFVNDQIIPNKPETTDISERMANPYEGAYVKTPDAGIYDNIVVFDFRGLYPSIIIAHNIDPSTLCSDCTDYYEAPNGAKFAKDKVGIMPIVLKMLIDERAEVKKAYKKDPDNKSLAARSSALKIIANAFYGYLGYARARWYSRECASAVTGYGRLFITQTIDEAEKFGFKVLYSDTDSIFMIRADKTKEDVDAFLKSANKLLPSTMELELEDFYTRGVFVGKRGGEGGAGAKKKYAMLSESGRIKIKGFELVRRDWSKVARDTQLAVLQAILHEGSKEKAVNIVKEVIERLKSGKVPLKELVINTQLRKGIGNYDIKSPELSAAKKALERGVKRKDELEGTTIGYIITKSGSSISEKAEIEETAQDYDPDYYIDHQIIPATLKILKELGYNADELRMKGAQKKLG